MVVWVQIFMTKSNMNRHVMTKLHITRLTLLVFQLKVRETDDLRANSQVNADLNTLISVLESPGENPLQICFFSCHVYFCD